MDKKVNAPALSDVMTPGLMISQARPDSREHEGETVEVLEAALAGRFFRAFQTVEIPCAEERQRIAAMIRRERVPLTCSLARVLNENGYDLSSSDQALRRRSIDGLTPYLDDAREQGADTIQLTSGPAPAGPTGRAEALDRLRDSLVEICRTASAPPQLKVIIEPLDVERHKKRALGSTREAVALVSDVRKDCANLVLCLDTAHMILNREDVFESLREAADYIDEWHFCNCVIDEDHPLFGDRHVPVGPPGALDLPDIADIMARGHRMGFFAAPRRPKVFCEVFNTGRAFKEMIEYYREVLQGGWRRAAETLEASAT